MDISPASTMTFQRFGRAYHLRIDNAVDLAGVLALSEDLWVATSAPIPTLRSDAIFLELVDADKDGRIRASELTAAIRWLLSHLADTTGLDEQSAALSLTAINADAPQGEKIITAARKMLARLGLSEDQSLTLEQIRRVKSQVQAMPVSEAGVVLPSAAGDNTALVRFIEHIISALGGDAHPSGAKGVSRATLDAFMGQARSYLAWREAGRPVDTPASRARLPLGDQTPAAFACLSQVRGKIDEYFAQCRALSFDPKLASQFPPGPATISATDFTDPQSIAAMLRAAPITTPLAEGVLDFSAAINPAWASTLEGLQQQVLTPILGEAITRLDRTAWRKVKDAFNGYEIWLASKPPDAVARIGDELLQTYLDPSFAEQVRELIQASQETSFQLDNIRLLEKLALYQANMILLANNFVSFPYLYQTRRRAMFEMGTLIIDGRQLTFAVRVDQRGEHAQVTATSEMFVLYLQVQSLEPMVTYEIAVPVTAGGKGNLVVGKRGIFIDVNGKQWDARVVQIIEHPISMREAMVAPFVRIGKMITGKIEQLTGTAEKQLDATTTASLSQVDTVVTGPPGPPPPEVAKAPPPPSAGQSSVMAGGLLAGGGLAVAAVGSAMAYITKTFAALDPWAIVFGITGALMIVLLPTAILAWTRLRRRDLSCILEGSGWAINARMRLTRTQCHHFTRRSPLPAGALGVSDRGWYLTLAVVLLITLAAVGFAGYSISQWIR